MCNKNSDEKNIVKPNGRQTGKGVQPISKKILSESF